MSEHVRVEKRRLDRDGHLHGKPQSFLAKVHGYVGLQLRSEHPLQQAGTEALAGRRADPGATVFHPREIEHLSLLIHYLPGDIYLSAKGG